MPAPEPKERRRFLRRHARAMRLSIMLLALLLIAPFLYMNEYGLPSFLKQKIVEELRSRGLDLQFSRLRWVWYQGLVADDVRLVPMNPGADIPQFTARQIGVKLNHAALWHFHLQVTALIVRGGQAVLPLPEVDQPMQSLSVMNIQTQLRFAESNLWELDQFSADFAGAKLVFAGSITNGADIRNWNIFRSHGTAQPELVRRRLRELARVIKEIQFTKPPELNVIVRGDARDAHTFEGTVLLDAPSAETPWGLLTRGRLLVTLKPPVGTNDLSRIEFKSRVDEIATRWGGSRSFRFNLEAVGDDQLTNLIHAQVNISASLVTTPWAQAAHAHLTARWTHSMTNPIPDAGTGELLLTGITTRWGSVDEVQMTTRLSTPATNGPPRADATWAWWAKLEPYFLDWNCRLKEVRADDFESKEVLIGGNWRAPELTITNLHTEMYRGQLNAKADLNVTNRAVHFTGASDFDVQKIYPFLPPKSKRWWREQDFAWEKPPIVHGSGSVILPAWTNHHPDWKNEVLPSLVVESDFKVGAGSYRKAQATSAQSHLYYSNRITTLPDLVATRPEGKLNLALRADDNTKDYYFHAQSSVDVKVMRNWIPDPKGKQAFDRLIFTAPPLVDAEIWGRWHDWSRSSFKATVSVTNFTYRDESADYFQGKLAFTNQFLLLTDARLGRMTNQFATLDALGLDLPRKRAFLTNGVSTLDPVCVTHAIGPKIEEMMSPYHFVQPPSAQVYGVIPLSDDIRMADMHFKLSGGPFEWQKFHSRHVDGMVNWTGSRMTINDMKADFYGGKLTGTAGFNFSKEIDGAQFNFDINVTQISLAGLLADVLTGTNSITGTVSGNLNITDANSHNRNSWFGKGHADLMDGNIWDIPIFGIFSDMLDKSLGVGKSRISEGNGDFIITNSIIASAPPDYLQLSSPSVRLLYRGTVDFDTKIDAVVDAQVFRNTPVVGDIFSLFVNPFEKLLETRVTGTLANPKRELYHNVPRWFLTPFLHPFRTIKDTFSGGSSSDDNTKPPPFAPPPAPALKPTSP